MNRRLLLLLPALCLLMPLRAEIEWLATDYDFGTWREADGKRTGMVRLVNHGPDEVVITSVRPSCGCTGADFFKDPVAPGDTAWVSFTYDPTRRPGRFEKTVKVYTDPGRVLQTIHIRGTIVGTSETMSNKYPVEAGSMMLTTLTHDFGNTPKGTPRYGYIAGYNPGSDTIHPHVSIPAGSPLSATIAKEGVAPGEVFTVSLQLPTRNLAAGSHTFPVTISCADTAVTAEVKVEVEPVREELSAEAMTVAPRVTVPTAPVEVTPGKPGAKVKFKFTLGNAGKSLLKVDRVYSRAAAVTVKKFPASLKPGKQGEVEGFIDLKEVDGPAFGFIIEVITNDPLRPVVTVRVTGQTPR